MQAIREIVTRDIFKNFDIPKEFGDEFEMILLPTQKTKVQYSGFAKNDVLNETEENEQSLAASYNAATKEDEEEDQIWMKYQSENGFSKNILAQESEDVWNDI